MTTLAMDNYFGYIGLDNVLAPSAYERTWNRSLVAPFLPSSKSFSARIDTALAFLLSKNVFIEERLLLEDILANNSGIVAHLYDVPTKVAEYFKTNSIEFGVFSDPDSNDTPEIYFEIETNLSPEEANSQLSLLNREWILSSSDEDLAKLNFTLKFV